MTKKKILFAGHSDDIVHVFDQGLQSTDDYMVQSENSPAAVFAITDKTGAGALVHAHYDKKGCWYFGLGRMLEDMPLPPWRVSIGTNDERFNGYTTVFIIEVPKDVKCMRLTA